MTSYLIDQTFMRWREFLSKRSSIACIQKHSPLIAIADELNRSSKINSCPEAWQNLLILYYCSEFAKCLCRSQKMVTMSHSEHGNHHSQCQNTAPEFACCKRRQAIDPASNKKMVRLLPRQLLAATHVRRLTYVSRQTYETKPGGLSRHFHQVTHS